jgi:hypothetical protein
VARAAALRRRRQQTAAGGGGLVGKSRKCDPGHGFDSGLAWEKESEEGNAFKGSGRGARGRGKQTVAACGRGAPASNRACGKAGKRGKTGRQRWPPPRGASAAHGGVPELGGKGGGAARVARQGGGGFIRRPRVPWRADPGQRAAGEAGTRASVGLVFKPKSGSRWKTRPTGGPRLSAREKGRREEGRVGGLTGPGKRRTQAAARLGHAGRKEKKEGQLGWAVRWKKKRLLAWALREEKERGKREKESGPDPKRKGGRKRIAFKCI